MAVDAREVSSTLYPELVASVPTRVPRNTLTLDFLFDLCQSF